MNNSIKSDLFLLFLVLVVISCRNKNEKSIEIDKGVEKLTDAERISEPQKRYFSNDTFSVVRVEKRRVFVSISDSLINKIKVIRSVIKTVQHHYPLDRLGISFFSDPKYAGYKDEFIKDTAAIRKWAYSYIGEFSSKEREYWTYPLFPDLKVKYIID